MTDDPHKKPLSSREKLGWPALAAGALAASLAFAIATAVYNEKVARKDLAVKAIRLQLDRQTLDLARAQLEKNAAENQVAMLTARELAYIALTGESSKAFGRIFWDQDKNIWHVYVFDLAPPPAGKTFALWFITRDNHKSLAGTFGVDAAGAGSIRVKVPTNTGELSGARITHEPVEGLEWPTGSILLSGKLH